MQQQTEQAQQTTHTEPKALTDRSHEHGFFYPLYFPFQQKDFFSRIWWLILLAYIPLINILIFTGWRFELIKNTVNDREALLPDFNLYAFLQNGLLIWFAGTCYVSLSFLIIFLMDGGFIGSILEIVHWVEQLMRSDPDRMTFAELVQSQISQHFIRIIVGIIWLNISIPIVRTGFMRYAATNRIGTLVNFPKNAALTLVHIKDHLRFFIFKLVMMVLIWLVSGIMFSTVALAIFIPAVSLSVFYWATGFEYGQLGKKIKENAQNRPHGGAHATAHRIQHQQNQNQQPRISDQSD